MDYTLLGQYPHAIDYQQPPAAPPVHPRTPSTRHLHMIAHEETLQLVETQAFRPAPERRGRKLDETVEMFLHFPDRF
jgi:hypothetical protein